MQMWHRRKVRDGVVSSVGEPQQSVHSKKREAKERKSCVGEKMICQRSMTLA